MKISRRLFVLLIAALLISACDSGEPATHTPMQTTATPEATATRLPPTATATSTPAPSPTATRVPPTATAPPTEQSLEHFRDPLDSFWVTIRIGLCQKVMGQYDEAIKTFQRALDLGRKSGQKVKQAWALTNTGNTVLMASDYADERHPSIAENHWREAVDLFREVDGAIGITRTNVNLGQARGFHGGVGARPGAQTRRGAGGSFVNLSGLLRPDRFCPAEVNFNQG